MHKPYIAFIIMNLSLSLSLSLLAHRAYGRMPCVYACVLVQVLTILTLRGILTRNIRNLLDLLDREHDPSTTPLASIKGNCRNRHTVNTHHTETNAVVVITTVGTCLLLQRRSVGERPPRTHLKVCEMWLRRDQLKAA